METKVKVKHRSAYGREIYDPICETGLLLLEFAGTKSFTKAQILVLKKLGYDVTFVVPGFEDG